MNRYTKLIWEDHFEGDTLDAGTWNIRYGNWQTDAQGKPVVPGWGNQELQYYTDSPDNLYVAKSCLHIVARQEISPDQFGKKYAYTSARIDTRERFSFTYGRVAVCACCPAGVGLWPAVWMMPQQDTYGSWAASGEIDILEAKGRQPDRVFGTIHCGGECPKNVHQEYSTHLPTGNGIDRFHLYELVWEPGCIYWLVDGKVYASTSRWPMAPHAQNSLAPFDRPFYLLINLAVGGAFDEEAKGKVTECFPAEFLVDYIQVYQ